MASDQEFVDFVLEQLSAVGEVTAKKMFGEYGLYAEGKFFGLVCDNKCFIKPTAAGRDFAKGILEEAPPYKGAKPSLLVEDQLEDRAWLAQLVRLSLDALPMPKPKRPKKKKQPNDPT